MCRFWCGHTYCGPAKLPEMLHIPHYLCRHLWHTRPCFCDRWGTGNGQQCKRLLQGNRAWNKKLCCHCLLSECCGLYMLCIDAAMHCSLDTTQLKHMLHMCILKNIFCLDICVVTTQCLHVLEVNYLVQQQVLLTSMPLLSLQTTQHHWPMLQYIAGLGVLPPQTCMGVQGSSMHISLQQTGCSIAWYLPCTGCQPLAKSCHTCHCQGNVSFAASWL